MKKQLIEVFEANCWLCDDPLPENSHRNRRFCPCKFGVIEWCKKKFDKLRDQLKLTNQIPPAVLSDTIKKVWRGENPAQITEIKNLSGPEQELAEVNVIDIRQRNIDLITKLIGDCRQLEITESLFLKSGYDTNIFDTKEPFLFNDIFEYNIGPYSIIASKSEIYLLTNTTK